MLGNLLSNISNMAENIPTMEYSDEEENNETLSQIQATESSSQKQTSTETSQGQGAAADKTVSNSTDKGAHATIKTDDSYAETIAQLAEKVAEDDSHGYSMGDARHGNGTSSEVTVSSGTYTIHNGDFDCSSLVQEITSTIGLHEADPKMYTSTEPEYLREAGFTEMEYDPETVQRGDILLNIYDEENGHTAIATGNGEQVHASHSEDENDPRFGEEGDQTQQEVLKSKLGEWQTMWRPPEGSPNTESTNTTKIEDATMDTEADEKTNTTAKGISDGINTTNNESKDNKSTTSLIDAIKNSANKYVEKSENESQSNIEKFKELLSNSQTQTTQKTELER